MPRAAATTDQERLERRRQRCKINQRRYRANIRRTKNQHRADMEVLGRINQQLEGHIATIQRTGLWYHAEEQSLLEYIRLFEFGYTQSPRQDTFLRCWIDPDGYCNHQKGLEAVTAMWVSYANVFKTMRVKCVRLAPVHHSSDATTVEMQCLVELDMSIATIQTLFPHVLSRQDLVNKMLVTPLMLSLQCTFVFDDRKRVTWQTSDANLVDALFRQFGNLDDIAFAAADTAMLPNGMILSSRPHNVTQT